MPELPSLLDYEDFRQYLRDYYAAQKRSDPAFSYGAFAKRSGIASRSHLKMVADGKKPLTPPFLAKYARGLRLGPQEARHFGVLVALGQAKGPEAREAARQALRQLRWERDRRRVSVQDVEEVLGHWPRLMVLCLSRLRGFRADPAWISRRLMARISPAEAAEALAFLRRRGFIRLRGRRLMSTVAGTVAIRRPEGADPAPLAAYKASALQEAARAALVTPGYGAWFFGQKILSREEANDLGARAERFLKAALPARRGSRDAGELCLVMLNVFPLSRAE